MLDWTDQHARYFLRLFSPNIRLYTEMITTQALDHGPRNQLLSFNAREHPVALQLGGNDPNALARNAARGQTAGFDEINLNVGCPSSRVQSGCFGASLMAKPERVAWCIQAMQQVCTVPVSIKCRLGIDDQDDYEFLHKFINITASAGCKIFVIHARNALLAGLSPKQNREIPPLNYLRVYQLKQDFPQLRIIINGGIKTLVDAKKHLSFVDGVMVGREAYQNPGFLLDADQHIFNANQHCNMGSTVLDRLKIAYQLTPYIENSLAKNIPLKHICRHTLGLFNHLPGARGFRRILSEEAPADNANIGIWHKALKEIESRMTEPTKRRNNSYLN